MMAFPYSRFVVSALVLTVVLAVLLNLRLHDWVAALHLAIIGVFELITIALAVRALVLWIITRRRPDDDPPDDDPPGYQKDFGLAA